jgi:hypothetical protein
MADLLVRVSPHWMDSLKTSEVNKLSEGEKQSYNSRTQIGDIIVVRPDGWVWGKEECLPNFIVVKVPSIPLETVKQYEQSLYDTTIPEKPVLLKRRKYRIPEVWVNANKTQNVITVNLKEQQNALINSIITKIS